MTPIRNQILFRPLPPEEQSTGGIFIPESARQVNNKGIAVSVGIKTKKVKPGDTVVRVKGWGEQYILDGVPHYLMNEEAILAIDKA